MKGILQVIWHFPLFGSILAIIACYCFYYLNTSSQKQRYYFQITLYALFAFTCLLFIGKIVSRILHPEVWDFMAFYLYAKVGVSGLNVYLPESFHTVFSQLQLPPLQYKEFIEECVNTGFLYPPPTLLLFTPMGFFSHDVALLIWTIFIACFAPLCIYLLYSLFLKQYKLNGLLLTSILFFLLSAVRETILYSQTNYILLFFLLLLYKYSTKNVAGVILAFAMFTKPYMAIFIVYFIVQKQWKVIAYFMATALILVGVTAAIFGTAIFETYLFNNPSKRLPAWVFEEGNNQSLHAVLLRAKLIAVQKPIVYTCIAAAIVFISGGFVLYLKKKQLTNYILPTLLLVALIIYPGTLSYYGVSLLFVLFQLYFLHKHSLNPKLWLAIITIFYFLTIVSLFATVCLLLFFIGYQAFKSKKVHAVDIP